MNRPLSKIPTAPFSLAWLALLTIGLGVQLPAVAQTSVPFPVPPPQIEPVLPPPVLPAIVSLAGASHGYMRAIHSPASIEVWRNGSSSPQKRARRGRRFDLTYLVGTEAAILRLKFNPKAAGKEIFLQLGPGVTLDPPEQKFLIEQNGHCDVSLRIDGSFRRSDVTVNCAGFTSKVTVERAAREIVEGEEEKSRRGQ